MGQGHSVLLAPLWKAGESLGQGEGWGKSAGHSISVVSGRHSCLKDLCPENRQDSTHNGKETDNTVKNWATI